MKSSGKILGIVLFSILVLGLQNIPQAAATAQTGDIGAVIESLEFNAADTTDIDIIQVSGDTFAAVYVDASGSGQVVTFTVDNAGDISNAIVDGPKVFNSFNVSEPKLFHITGDIYGVVFTDNGNITLDTMNISSDGITIVQLTPAGGIAGTPITGTSPDIVKLSGAAGATQFYAVGYSSTANAGTITTMSINAAGTTVTEVTAATAIGSTGIDMELIKLVDATQYAAVYHTGTKGQVEIFSVADTGGTLNVGGDIEILFAGANISATSTFDIRHITGTTYAVAYVGPSNQGIVETIATTNNSVNVATLDNSDGGSTFGGGNVVNPVFLLSFDSIADLPLIIAYTDGSDNSGDLASLTINAGTGVVSDQVDTENFDTTLGIKPSIAHRTGNFYVVSYEGTANNGFVSSFNLGEAADTTPPTATLSYSGNGEVFKQGQAVTITAVFNEPLADSPKVKLAIDNSELSATDMTKDSSTQYTFNHTILSGGDIATVTASLSVGEDLSGNVITSVPTSGATFEIDNTDPAILAGGIVFVSATDLVINFNEDITSTNLNVGNITFNDGAPQTADLDTTTIIGNSLSISLINITGTISSTVSGSLSTLTVEDIAGNQLFIVGATAIPVGDPTPTLDFTTTTATLTDDSFITSIDASASTDVNNVPTIIISGSVTPPQDITIIAPSSIATIVLPASTTLTGGDIIEVKVSTVTNPVLTQTITGEIVVGTVLEIGDPTNTITFDKPVKITLPGLAGNNPFIIPAGSTFAVPIPACGGTTPYADDTAATAGGSLNDVTDECAYEEAGDIVVWSRHFSSFGASTPDDLPTLLTAIITASAQNANKIQLTFSENVTLSDTTGPFFDDFADLKILGAARNVTAVAGSGTSTIELTFDGDAVATNATGTIDIAGTITDGTGNNLTAIPDRAITDGLIPTVVPALTNPTTITVTYSESVSTVVGHYTDLNLALSGPQTITGFSGLGSTYTITITPGASAPNETGTIDISNSVVDTSANALVLVDNGIVRDGQSPQFDSGIITGPNTIDITYTEFVTTVLGDYSDLQLSETGSRTVTGITGSGTTYTLTFGGNPAATGETATIDIATTVVDFSGNPNTTNQNNPIADGQPPTVTFAVSGSNTITATFSEPVTTVLGDYSDLQLFASGPRTITAVTGSGTTHALTFDGGPALPSENGTIDVANTIVDTSPAANAIVAINNAPVTASDVIIPPTITSPIDGDILNINVIPVTGTYGGGTERVDIVDTDGTTIIGTEIADGSGNFTINTIALDEGSHTITVQAIDGAITTNSNSVTILVDTITPEIPTINLNDGDILTIAAFDITGTAEADSTVELFNGTTSLGTTTADTNGNYSLAVSLVNDTYIITATATDLAGNTSDPTVPITIIIDAELLVPTITSPIDGETLSTDLITVTGTADPNVIIELFDGIFSLGTTTSNATNGNWSKQALLSDGSHSLSATATRDGITSANSVAVTITIDTGAPSLLPDRSYNNDLQTVFDSRPDLQAAFPEASSGDFTNLYGWAFLFGIHESPTLLGQHEAMYSLLWVYHAFRPDLQTAFPEAAFGADISGLLEWASLSGITEHANILADDEAVFNMLWIIQNFRPDLQSAFPEALNGDDLSNIWEWGALFGINEHANILADDEGIIDVMWVYEAFRPDLQAAFPEANNAGTLDGLFNWAANFGVNEHANILGEHASEYAAGPP